MEEWLVGIDRLPTFRDGQPLSAKALNRIGAAQRYLNGRYSQVRPAVPYVNYTEAIHIVHKHRYLHYDLYQFQADPTRVFRLEIDGKGVLTLDIDHASGHGVIDLNGNYLDATPINLPVGTKYKLQWVQVSGNAPSWWSGVYSRETYESDNSSAMLTLPYASQTFADGQSAITEKLNAISQNTTYLLTDGGLGHVHGFPLREGGIQASGTTSFWYRMRHTHRYLNVYASLVTGYDSSALDFWINVNGSTLFTDHQEETGFASFYYKQFVDLNTTGLSAGDGYTIEIKAYKSSWDSVLFSVYFVGETPDDDYPAW